VHQLTCRHTNDGHHLTRRLYIAVCASCGRASGCGHIHAQTGRKQETRAASAWPPLPRNEQAGRPPHHHASADAARRSNRHILGVHLGRNMGTTSPSPLTREAEARTKHLTGDMERGKTVAAGPRGARGGGGSIVSAAEKQVPRFRWCRAAVQRERVSRGSSRHLRRLGS